MKKRVTSLLLTFLMLVGTIGIGMSSYLRSEDPPVLMNIARVSSEDPPVLRNLSEDPPVLMNLISDRPPLLG